MSDDPRETIEWHSMENIMRLWEEGSKPPKEALKTIKGGRIAGMTDINPQWRFKKLTEMFGPCGKGWWIVETRRDFVPCGDEIAVFVDVELHIAKWDMPISGTGGNMFRKAEGNGLRCNDEAIKMAKTDAIGVACRQLGIGSAIYEGQWDGSKYADEPTNEPKTTQSPSRSAFSQGSAEANDDAGAPNYKFLKAMKEQKERLGEAMYYDILKQYGYEKANKITSRSVQKAVYDQMKSSEPVKETE